MPSEGSITSNSPPMISSVSRSSTLRSSVGRSLNYGPEYRVFSDGNMEGGIYKSELKSRTENGASLIILFADNLEATRDRVTEHGGSICKNIISFPGGRRFQFLDPHGNELGV